MEAEENLFSKSKVMTATPHNPTQSLLCGSCHFEVTTAVYKHLSRMRTTDPRIHLVRVLGSGAENVITEWRWCADGEENECEFQNMTACGTCGWLVGVQKRARVLAVLLRLCFEHVQPALLLLVWGLIAGNLDFHGRQRLKLVLSSGSSTDRPAIQRHFPCRPRLRVR